MPFNLILNWIAIRGLDSRGCAVNPHLKQVLYFLLVEEDTELPRDILRDSIWLLLVAFALSLFRSAIEHFFGRVRGSGFLSTLDESLFYTAIIAIVCRSLRRIYNWLLGRRVQSTDDSLSILTTSWGYAGCVLTLGTTCWGLLRMLLRLSFEDTFVTQTVLLLIFTWGVTGPSRLSGLAKSSSD